MVSNIRKNAYTTEEVNYARKKLFSGAIYKAGSKEIRDLTPDFLNKLSSQICLLAGGGAIHGVRFGLRPGIDSLMCR